MVPSEVKNGKESGVMVRRELSLGPGLVAGKSS